MRNTGRAVAGILAPLLIWSGFFLFAYIVVGVACARPPAPHWLRPLVWFSGVAAGLATVMFSHRFLRQLRRTHGADQIGPRIGLYLSVIALVAILWTLLPTLFVRPCE